MRVQDWKENEIKVGSRVVYGQPDTAEELANQTAVVTEISEPDVVYNPVTDADDGGYEVEITVKFADGDTDKLRARIKNGRWDSEETFEEGGDLQVIMNDLKCPECGEAVWDLPVNSKLAKCWNTEGHADGGTLAFDTMEES